MKEYKTKTNIVISCWNAIDHTEVTVNRLFDTVHHHFFLTIINNGSKDGTKEFLDNLEISDFCEKITIIHNEDNQGAGGAINQGHEISKKYGIKYTCLCNNDLYFQDNWLEPLEEKMESDDSIGILGTLRPATEVIHHTFDKPTKEIVDSTPKEYSIDEELNFFQNGFSFDETCKKIIDKNGGGVDVLRCPPNAVITCCAIVRSNVTDKIDLLSDPQFEIYGSEDIDLSWRLQGAGYKCCILKDVYVHHFRHRSITSSNLDREKFLLENNTKFFNKWESVIYDFLDKERGTGVDINMKMGASGGPEYLFLRMINDKINFISKYEDGNK